jgi:hypothetical protein
MATDYGTDISCYPDIDASFGVVSGFTLIEDLARRLETPRGGLFYDSNYGTDVRGWVNAAGTPAQIATLKAGDRGRVPQGRAGLRTPWSRSRSRRRRRRCRSSS